jgi:Tol biopolymer transport system component
MPDQKAGSANRRLTWVDRGGTSVGTVGALTSASSLRFSPKATLVALVDIQPPSPGGKTTGTLSVADLGRNVRTPLTPATGFAASPTWSADSERLLFAARTGDANTAMFERIASGATPASLVYEDIEYNVAPLAESSDGKLVVFSKGLGGRRALQILSRADKKVSVYLAGELDYSQASLSPDDKWLAYSSNEYGPYEVIVQSFPDPSRGKWKISTNGGSDPRWRSDGRELFYLDSEQRLVAVPITVNRELVPGRPTPLFSLPMGSRRNPSGSAYVYDAAPDGQRFLISMPMNASRIIPLTVTTNWTSLIEK